MQGGAIRAPSTKPVAGPASSIMLRCLQRCVASGQARGIARHRGLLRSLSARMEQRAALSTSASTLAGGEYDADQIQVRWCGEEV